MAFENQATDAHSDNYIGKDDASEGRKSPLIFKEQVVELDSIIITYYYIHNERYFF